MPVDFVLDDRQKPNQCRVEQHRIQLFGAKFDAVSLICGSRPLAKRSNWTKVLNCGPWMDSTCNAAKELKMSDTDEVTES